MHPNLTPLPHSLISALGRCHRHDALADGLARLPQPVLNLRQTRGGKVYSVRVPSQGLDLMLQCINPQAPEPQQVWGLQSITLHTALSEPDHCWPHEWPQGITPTTQATDIGRLFGADNADADSSIVTPTMTCFSVQGFDGQTWNMVCTFDSDTECLQTLSLIRAGDWIAEIAPPAKPE